MLKEAGSDVTPWRSDGGLHVAVLIDLKHVYCVCPKRNISTNHAGVLDAPGQ